MCKSSPVNCDLLFVVPSVLGAGLSEAKLEIYLFGILAGLRSC